MSNGFLINENPFFKHDIDKLCLICNHQFKMDQAPHSILDRLEQTQPEPQMNVYDALESISNFKEIKLQKKAEKICEFCFKNISRVIKFCEMCNKSASFLKSYIQYQEMNNISLSDTINPMTYNDRPMLTELTGANVLSIKPELLNEHKQQDVKMQEWPEFVTISTVDTLSSTTETTLLEKEEKDIANMEGLAKVICTKPKIVNDEVEQNVKNIWPELVTIITGDTLNCTATMPCKEKTIIQQEDSTNIETYVEVFCTNDEMLNDEKEPDLKMEIWPELPAITTSDTLNWTAAILVKEEISNLPEKGITNIETCSPHECKYDPLECKYDPLECRYECRSFACEKCGKSFSSRKQLEQHIIIHLEVKRHECKVCGKAFPQPSKLKEHLSVHSDEKPFACERCGKCFSTRKRLKGHMTIHMEVKRHECNVCGKKFLRSSDMKLHLKLHSDEKEVCEKCGKCVSTRKRLQDHMISHLEVKEHECKVCGKQFLRSSDLKLHLRLHSDERPFKCEKCGKLFSGRPHLRQHMISHSEAKRHECHLCGNRFKHPHSLRKHLSNHCKLVNY